MGYITPKFDCLTCKNNNYCADFIKARTTEVWNALDRDNSPALFIKQKAPANIMVCSKCALETGRVSIEEITRDGCARVIKWDLCGDCNKRKVCHKTGFTKKWAREQKEDVEKDLNSASISAPWTDSVISCKDKPDKAPKKIGFTSDR